MTLIEISMKASHLASGNHSQGMVAKGSFVGGRGDPYNAATRAAVNSTGSFFTSSYPPGVAVRATLKRILGENAVIAAMRVTTEGTDRNV